MHQFEGLLTEGTKYQIMTFGLTAQVYRTHRTAAAPQYVYDNAAKNVTRALVDPRGGRYGFTGAVGGPPFPIIDISDPLVAGAQLIWNHLTSWQGYSAITRFDPYMVVVEGEPILAAGTLCHTVYPYYAPDVTPDNYDGYYSKGHYYCKAPATVVGQETLVWHSTNVNVCPDITWTLLNGQGRVRKAPDEAYDTPDAQSNGVCNIDELSCFYGNPSQYDWTYITKKEMLVPYNCNKILFSDVQRVLGPNFPRPEFVRWEKHRVWIVEATLAPGENNMTAKRRLYIDEDTWSVLLGEGYDTQGDLVKSYAIYNECVPSMPGTTEMSSATYALDTGNYSFFGNNNYAQFSTAEFLGPLPGADFEPQEMAAKASF